ncbi:helix-hairpin-helix domain-containing protein [Desulfosporosinus sp. Sb-LF]|uniref:helix-hairpin-helix domain-containing protein n=1 Tax=Desulfosporosinus sp. Sb-LF TaxID=2560027 RepID=UPI00107F378F|nr:helix-hairpin-helix domain-containing protein [Desulfosporosinus sp. Sb-LF]TGE32510.1 helix-hairpin-helix domain-containing protein [Desulfosporosinus sp. Sb-LF]
MERKLRYVWWFVIVGFVVFAIWRLFLPHGSNAYLQKTASNREIVVYVTGAVEKPGLVHLNSDARLDDALKQVSPLQEANLESMNPAEKLKDGQKVSVPYKSPPLAQGSAVIGNPNSAGVSPASQSVPTPAASPTTAANPASVAVPTPSGGKININTAGAAELDKLSGVGPALAERILQYRAEHGLFARAEDLKNVSGIGDKTYEKMAAQVTVSP